MTARVIASFSSGRIAKQDLLIGPHGVDHACLVVMALGDNVTLMMQHGHCQSHLRHMMDGSAGCKAGSDQMRSDPLAEGGTGPSADRAIKRILAKRAAVSAEPKPVCRLGVTKQRAVVLYVPIDAGGAPGRQ